MNRKLYIAIPLLDELDYLDRLIDCIRTQDDQDFEVLFCVNQPDSWWQDPVKKEICQRNLETMKKLDRVKDVPLRVIDRSSPGLGWKGKKHGVGMARKTLMDAVEQVSANVNDMIISLDGDTTFGSGYFSSVRKNFEENPAALSISIPYYHPLSGNDEADLAILRYEIYMRHYLLNMLRIGSPYSFTALGSAIASTVKAYRKIGGMTPVLSGEDFYFLQKMVKTGSILIWNDEKVFPAARFSDRVYFGTGPAMIRGRKGDWSSYPVYHPDLFDNVRKTYDLFPDLYNDDIQTPMDDFLAGIFPGGKIWKPLRDNSSGQVSFMKACHQKIDGLRILQYLKSAQNEAGYPDEASMKEFLEPYYPGTWNGMEGGRDIDLDAGDIATLKKLRELYTQLCDQECRKQKLTGIDNTCAHY